MDVGMNVRGTLRAAAVADTSTTTLSSPDTSHAIPPRARSECKKARGHHSRCLLRRRMPCQRLLPTLDLITESKEWQETSFALRARWATKMRIGDVTILPEAEGSRPTRHRCFYLGNRLSGHHMGLRKRSTPAILPAQVFKGRRPFHDASGRRLRFQFLIGNPIMGVTLVVMRPHFTSRSSAWIVGKLRMQPRTGMACTTTAHLSHT
jgi:hypothetical protein